jgi:hypothetical protein
MIRITAAVATLFIGVLPVDAKTCRAAQDVPPGVRVPSAPGCKATAGPGPQAREPQHVRTEQKSGFIDIGNGTAVRINGRVRAETVFHR